MKSGVDGNAVEIARAYLDALSSDEPANVIRLVADDFVNVHLAELGSGCVGRDEYARRLPGFFAMFPGRRYTVERVAIGEMVSDTGVMPPATEVIVEYRFGADVDSTRIDLPGVMWVSVRDGAIARRLDSWDSLTFHRQTGTPIDGWLGD